MTPEARQRYLLATIETLARDAERTAKRLLRQETPREGTVSRLVNVSAMIHDLYARYDELQHTKEG